MVGVMHTARLAMLACGLTASACGSTVLTTVDACGADAGFDAGGDTRDGGGDPGRADPGTGETGCGRELSWSGRGDLLPDAEPLEADLERCTQHAWSLVAPAGSRLEIRLEALGVDTLLAAVVWPDDRSWQGRIMSLSAGPGLAGSGSFTPPRSGEFLVAVRSLDPERPSSYRLSVVCLDGCERETTRFPLVLVHGWTGWGEIGPVEYFYNVPDFLAGYGYPVYVPVCDPYNSVEVRSEQLAPQLDWILDQTRARKLDLVAHSQGGLDARRVISTLGYGDRVAALVTVATPHHGTPIADIALGLLPGPAQEALAFLLELLGAAGGNQSDAIASFESLTTTYVEDEFNPHNPDDPRVRYVSWTGLTCPLGIECGDICDVEIRWAYDLIYLAAGDNDGMVPVSSAPWGDYRGTVPADHFDEIGQLLGVTGPNFDHEAFYLQLARDLAAAGL